MSPQLFDPFILAEAQAAQREGQPLRPNPVMPGEPVSDAWIPHASTNVASEHCACLWKNSGNACRYIGDTRMVKRHIESKHLCIKRHVCELCSRPFAQKSNLDVHRQQVHQKDGNVFSCGYETCKLTFMDRATRLHHMEQVHGHVTDSS
ncbi:hypothetical protein BXZ70DRAFT_405847 [Cristinia sonorae]|uniref:C2H2-type domain-containing protein n=1 Tax=Cristinia sonorae TaxID=1940300 RepID=A0A8K0UVU6_9AGAR|nr:hypothetical protein BXZ70DRAFT_405847 [Cristinia sonorae]